MRFTLAKGIKVVAGVFDLSRPYFGYDSANIFRKVGTVRSRGAEFSISGSLTPRLDIVAGGVILDPKVTCDAEVAGEIGPKPVGIAPDQLSFNANWKTPFVRGLELDAVVIHRGRTPATTDNLVFVPTKFRLDLGTLARRDATLRLQVFNVTNGIGYGLPGSGIYGQNPGRFLQGFLTVDL